MSADMMNSHAPAAPPLQALSTWLTGRVPDVADIVDADLVAAGRSNLTYRLTDAAGRHLVLRRPPARIAVQGAHDVLRECRILRALHAQTTVRVPEPLAASDADGPLGAPFFVMSFVDGVVVRDDASAARLVEMSRREAGLSAIDELASLHAVDPRAVGLGDLGKPSGYLERNLRRWAGQIGDDAPFAKELRAVHERLSTAIPEQQSTALIHGDFRLDNCILADSGAVQAVLDWELSTQGDPLADLGWMLLYWQPPADLAPILPRGSDATGFPSGAELAQRYAEATSADLTRLDYYLAFAAWRLAVITLGVRARYSASAGAGDPLEVAGLIRDVEILAGVAADHLN